MFWILYRHFRVPIDFVCDALWWRLAKWRVYQLRGMEKYHVDLASMPNMDPATQLKLAEECGEFARMLEEDTAG